MLINIIFAAVLLVALQRLSKDSNILADLVYTQEQPARLEPETAMEYVRRAVLERLHAYNCLSYSSHRRAWSRVDVFGVLGLTFSTEKAGTLSLSIPYASPTRIAFTATGHQNCQKISFIILGGTITESLMLSTEIDHRVITWLTSSNSYLQKLYNHPSTSVELKARIVKSKMVGARLYG